MKTRHTSVILLLLALLFSVPLSAQKLTVESMKLDVTDVTGSLDENLVRDNNGNYGGLVRVYLAAPNATFEGSVLRQQQHSASEYWVVVAKGYYRLKVVVPGFQPLDVNFRDYNIKGIKSQHTYVLTINVPQLLQAGSVDDGKRYFVLNVNPKNATVLVDKQSQQVTNGQMSILLTKGDHEYSISAPGYSTEEGVVTIAGEKVTKSVQLKSARSTLKVSCSTQGAKIYVNDELRGTSPWTGELNSGEYRVEARLDGYRSCQESVTLGAREEKSISFPSLTAITGMLNVNYLPAESEVYIDGKKVGTSPDIFRNIAVGSRSVEIRKEGYEPLRKTVEVKENEQASLTGSLSANVSSIASASTNMSVAQEMKVENMILDPMDLTTYSPENMYMDNNGEYGGLVKVMLAAPNAKFEGWVLHQEQRNASEYWVFMAKGSNKLKVIVDGYLPMQVDFRDYKDCIIQSKLTYVLTIRSANLSAAQEMNVKSMVLDEVDATANDPKYECQDNNGEYGGLVKVRLAAPNAKFEGWVLHQEQRNAVEYWVFMAKGSRRVKVFAEGYLPLEVKFSDYGIDGIQSGRTYRLDIMLP